MSCREAPGNDLKEEVQGRGRPREPCLLLCGGASVSVAMRKRRGVTKRETALKSCKARMSGKEKGVRRRGLRRLHSDHGCAAMGYTVHTDFFIEGRHALLFAVNGGRGRAFDFCLSPEHREGEST